MKFTAATHAHGDDGLVSRHPGRNCGARVPSRMRVLLFTPNYPGVTSEGGIGTYTKDLANGLAAIGHHVVVLTLGDGAPVMDGPVDVRQLKVKGLPFADLLMPGFGVCSMVAVAMRRLIREHAIDVVEFPNWDGLGVIHQFMTRVPTVVRLSTSSLESQGIDNPTPSRHLRWDVRRERWQARRAAALVTHSEVHRELMARELEIPVEDIHLVKLGIPVFEEFKRTAPRNQSPTVVYLGRLEKRKGTVDLFHAIPAVLAQHPDAQFIFIGGDRPHCPGNLFHAEYLKQEFSEDVRRHVHLMGKLPQADVDRWLQQADVFVAPSLYESFGLIFVEAMRWGTPVIGTLAGGIPEIITDGETGLLVRPSQPSELASAITRLLGDSGLRVRLGLAGRRHVEQNFSIARMVDQEASLYQSVLASR